MSSLVDLKLFLHTRVRNPIRNLSTQTPIQSRCTAVETEAFAERGLSHQSIRPAILSRPQHHSPQSKDLQQQQLFVCRRRGGPAYLTLKHETHSNSPNNQITENVARPSVDYVPTSSMLSCVADDDALSLQAVRLLPQCRPKINLIGDHKHCSFHSNSCTVRHLSPRHLVKMGKDPDHWPI